MKGITLSVTILLVVCQASSSPTEGNHGREIRAAFNGDWRKMAGCNGHDCQYSSSQTLLSQCPGGNCGRSACSGGSCRRLACNDGNCDRRFLDFQIHHAEKRSAFNGDWRKMAGCNGHDCLSNSQTLLSQCPGGNCGRLACSGGSCRRLTCNGGNCDRRFLDFQIHNVAKRSAFNGDWKSCYGPTCNQSSRRFGLGHCSGGACHSARRFSCLGGNCYKKRSADPQDDMENLFGSNIAS